MHLSFWELDQYFRGNDLVIVGSGIVGLNTAIEFKTKYPQRKVLIIERGVLPLGASTKNAGFACFGSLSELNDDLTKMPLDRVLHTVEMRWKGLLKLRKLLGDKAMDYKDYGGFEVFDNERSFATNAETIDYWNNKFKFIEKGQQVYKIEHSKIRSNGLSKFDFCIKNKFEGQIDTGKMMVGLLKLAISLDVKILNGVELDSFSDGLSGVKLCLKGGIEFLTPKLIIATNGFAKQLLPKYDVRPARAQVLITKPIKNLKLKGSFHYDEGYYYFRNINNRVLFGGGRNLDFETEETVEFGNTTKVQSKLNKILKENILAGVDYEIDHNWSGIMGIGAEKKPIIEHVSNNVICAVRMGGMGVAIGSLVGELAIKELQGKKK